MSLNQKYIEAIQSGEIVAFPTETVYGLGADAFNAEAISKVFSLKGRPSDNPLIVHISDKEQLLDFTEDVSDLAKKLISHFWPGPLTLVFKKRDHVLDVVTAGLDTVAIRMPDNKIALELIQKTGPLVAPSANKSGTPSPTKASHVFSDFGNSVLIIDGGSTQLGLESTVLDISGEKPIILRPGSIGISELESILEIPVSMEKPNIVKPKSPGQKYSHYKPSAEINWLQDSHDFNNNTTLFLLLNGNLEQNNIINYQGNFDLLANELYDRFRQADIDGYKKIVIEPFDDRYEHSVIPALLNRINKAMS